MIAWLFALPFVLGFAIFMLFPIVSSFLMSFTDFTSRDVQNPLAVGFVGVGQYADLFADPRFLKSMSVTAYFVVVGIPLTMIVALILAVALNSGINQFRTVFRVGFYTPVVTSIVAVAVIWQFILQDDGLLNTVLGWVGIDGPELAEQHHLGDAGDDHDGGLAQHGHADDHLPGRPAGHPGRGARRPPPSTGRTPGPASGGSPCRCCDPPCCSVRCCCPSATCSSSRSRS